MDCECFLKANGKKIRVDEIWTEVLDINGREFRRFYARFQGQTISAPTEKDLSDKLLELARPQKVRFS